MGACVGQPFSGSPLERLLFRKGRSYFHARQRLDIALVWEIEISPDV